VPGNVREKRRSFICSNSRKNEKFGCVKGVVYEKRFALDWKEDWYEADETCLRKMLQID
jgi:hypothetical protein